MDVTGHLFTHRTDEFHIKAWICSMCNTEDKLECVTWKLYKTQCLTGRRRFRWVNREEWRGRGTRVLRRRRELCCCCCPWWSRLLATAMVQFGGAIARVRSKHPVLGAQPSGMDILFKTSQLRAHNFSDFHNARKSYGLSRLPQCYSRTQLNMWS